VIEGIEMEKIDFLTGPKLFEKIKKLVEDSEKIKFAVAFWGDGAPEQLGLIDENKDIKIICNLKSGATNPKIIRMLMAKYCGRIKTYDKLHAKVYLGERGAIVGSANASSNGLNYEGLENQGWIEAGLFINEENVIKNIENWFSSIWQQSKDINESQLKMAEENWLKRRKSRIIQERKSSLLINLHDHPDDFKDKSIYFVIYNDRTTKDAKNKMKEIKGLRANIFKGISNTKLEFYENWEKLPEDSKLIDIFYDGTKVKFEGFYKMPEKKVIIPFKYEDKSDGSMNLCYEIDYIDSLKLSANDKEIIEQKINLLFQKGKGDESGRYLSLIEARSILFS
jgi:hypothetical protein